MLISYLLMFPALCEANHTNLESYFKIPTWTIISHLGPGHWHLIVLLFCPPAIPQSLSSRQGVVSPRCMEGRPHGPCPPATPWSLSDSGWLWARSGLGLGVQGGSGCCTDMVRRRWLRLHRKSGFAGRPNEPFLRTMRTEEDFLGLALCPNWRVERCAA